MLGVADRNPEVRGSGTQQVLTRLRSAVWRWLSMGPVVQGEPTGGLARPMLNGIIPPSFSIRWSGGSANVLVSRLPRAPVMPQLTLAQARSNGAGP